MNLERIMITHSEFFGQKKKQQQQNTQSDDTVVVVVVVGIYIFFFSLEMEINEWNELEIMKKKGLLNNLRECAWCIGGAQ